MNISSLHTDYLNLDRSSGFGTNTERANTDQKKCTFFEVTDHSAEKLFQREKKGKIKSRATGASDKRRTECTPRKGFRCGS